ncbi:hypothetical protein D3C75_599930 [compost metagenome]
MHVNAHQRQVIALQHLQRRRQVAVPDPVLTVFAAGVRFLTVAVTKAWVNAQPDAMAR